MIPGAPVTNIAPTKKPIVINLPDGSQIKSTHTCEIDNPDLPQEARQAHIVPGLAHTSLISIKMLCDAKCILTYDDEACTVYYKNKIVWIGKRDPSTGLWILALKPTNPKSTDRPETTNKKQGSASKQHQVNNAYHMSTKQELIQYLHQSLFCPPPKRTLLKAIKNNQLTTWPGLTKEAVEK
eukprot:scaffold61041_cov42-Attheya_sp.AAC.1